MKRSSSRASRQQDEACRTREEEKSENKDNETPKNKKIISYRRPGRDYSTHMTWTLEMHIFLYKSYLEVKSQGLGYQKRLKSKWDEKYPELRELTTKHLASQVRNILKKNPNIGSEVKEHQNKEQNPGSNEQNQQNAEQGRSQENDWQSDNQNESDRTGQEQTSEVTSGENDEKEQERQERYEKLKEEIKPKFHKNFNKYITMNINYREYSTKTMPAPEKNNIQIINEITSEELGNQPSNLDQ